MEGTIAQDFLELGSLLVKVNITIGHKDTLVSWESLQSDGILGLNINSVFLASLTSDLRVFTVDAQDSDPTINFGDHATYSGTSSSLKSSSKWDISLDRLGFGNFYNVNTPDNVRLDSEIMQIYLPTSQFNDFKDKYITANCFKADDHFDSSSFDGNTLYYCYCNGGGPDELPKFNFIINNHRFGLALGDYMGDTFVDSVRPKQSSNIAYCGLGIAKTSSDDVILGASFFKNFEVTFDPNEGQIHIKDGQRMSFWVVFDLNLALTGGILFTVLFITIVVFGIKRHRRLKAEAEQATLEFVNIPDAESPRGYQAIEPRGPQVEETKERSIINT
jgi:hypothetical protein